MNKILIALFWRNICLLAAVALFNIHHYLTQFFFGRLHSLNAPIWRQWWVLLTYHRRFWNGILILVVVTKILSFFNNKVLACKLFLNWPLSTLTWCISYDFGFFLVLFCLKLLLNLLFLNWLLILISAFILILGFAKFCFFFPFLGSLKECYMLIFKRFLIRCWVTRETFAYLRLINMRGLTLFINL